MAKKLEWKIAVVTGCPAKGERVNGPIVLFDEVCKFCNATGTFLIDQDKCSTPRRRGRKRAWPARGGHLLPR
jgi:hypothetical protein